MSYPCSGVILAGGLATRFSGITKAFLNLDGKTILDRIYDLFSQLFDEIILVTNTPMDYLDWDLDIVTDLYPVRSSLTGIHAGLFYASNPYAFFTASDTPFLEKALIELLLDNIDESKDIIIPETSKGLEPLCAVYSTNCLQNIEHHLNKESFKIREVFKKTRMKKVTEKQLRQAGLQLSSFFNINTPEDLHRAQSMLQSDH